MSEVGSAYFTLLPSVKGLQGAIAREVGGLDGATPGKAIGSKLGGGIAGGIKSLVGPALVVGAGLALKGFIADGIEGVKGWQVLQAQTDAAIKSTGGSANVTGEHIHTLSTRLEGLTATQGESIQQGANMLLTFTNIQNRVGQGNDIFDQATLAVVDYSRATGTDAKAASIQLGKALNDPIKGVTALGRAGIQFTDQQKAQIKVMQESGDILGAQKIVLAEVNKQFGGSGAAYAKTTAGQLYLLSDAYGDVGEGIVKGFMPAVGATAGLLTNVLNAVGPKVEELSAVGGQMVVKLLQSGPQIKSAIDGIVSLVRDGDFTGQLASAFGIEEDNPIVTTFLSIRDTVGNVIGQLAPVFGQLAPLALQLWSSFSPLSIVFQALTPVLPALVGALTQLGVTIGTVLAGSLAVVMPVLIQVSGVLVDALGQVFTAVAPLIVSLLGEIGTYFGLIAPVVITLVAVVAQLVGQLVGALVPIFVQLVTAVFPIVVQAFGLVLQAVVPLVTMIAGVLVPVIQALLPVVVAVFSAVASVIQTVMQVVLGVIQVVTGIITGNWSQVWNGILNILQGVWNTIVAVIRGALSIVGAVISAGINLAGQVIRSVFQGVVGFLGGVWSNIVNGVSGMIGNVLSFFSGLGGRILGALGNVAGVLFSAGVNIVQGLINGIGSMMGAIGRAVLSIVPEAIRGPFEALLGIHSPSLVATWWGEMLGLGLVNGIEDSTPAVAGATAKLGAAAMPSLALQGSRSTYRPLGGLGADAEHLEIHVHGDMFGDAREVAVELQRNKRRAVQVHNIDAIAAGV